MRASWVAILTKILVREPWCTVFARLYASMKKQLVRLLTMAWSAPVGVFIWMVVLLAWATRLVRLAGPIPSSLGLALRFYVPDGAPAWWLKRWDGWTAVSFPYGMATHTKDVEDRLVRHEARHLKQWAVLGPLFLPAYGVAGLVALVRGGKFHHDNWFERDARAAETIA